MRRFPVPPVNARRIAATYLLALGAVTGHAAIAQSARSAPMAMTREGPVSGSNHSAIRRYLGIPYAAPPTGALRWRPPAPPALRRSLLHATRFGNSCPQVTTLGVYAGPTSITEDCLYLNIYAPDTPVRKGRRLPVIVWLHGGGLVTGSADGYDGSWLASGGPDGTATIVVTVNYRLGLLGFLSHPALRGAGQEATGNFGLMDVVRALKWTRANIAAFGGDPDNVTVGGQSSGASLASALMLAPSAKGLFRRTILESGPLSTVATASLARQRGEEFAAQAGCADSQTEVASCLRRLPVSQILQMQGKLGENGQLAVGLAIDGQLIPRPPLEAWRTGTFNRVPVLGGTVRDEGRFALLVAGYNTGEGPLAADQLAGRIKARYPARLAPGRTAAEDPAARLASEYTIQAYGSATDAFGAFNTDPIVCRVNRAITEMAKWTPVNAYEFRYRDAPFYFPPQAGVAPWAAHTIDLQFIFPGWHGGELGINHRPQTAWTPGEISGPERGLSDRLLSAWTRFAAMGAPDAALPHSGQGKIPAPWPQFGVEGHYQTQDVGQFGERSAREFRDEHRCDLWDMILTY
ncbi:carboxylesterase family protein [Novosphingobium flavum]|uniref:Carboxylic ester hydrolase n=1 Tax=Novosphingobium flavum TaxID=1778672 RepID=A0A7X1KMT5_9SPHN|nr:carboxylesterase family protein [Novosphingobium flavum]MBC2666989.1 carboxylesterase family protein [Novosphingobium flavum]